MFSEGRWFVHPCNTAVGVVEENLTKNEFYYKVKKRKEKKKNKKFVEKNASMNDFTQIIEYLLHFPLFTFIF